jgi:uncharacterized protein YdaU (DUF1376 family)
MPLPWFSFYVGDYLKQTMALTTLEHGAYLLLLLHAWSYDGALPCDDRSLAHIARMTVPEWRRHATKLRGFFEESNGQLRSAELDSRIQEAKERSRKQSERAKIRWHRKIQEPDEEGRAVPRHSESHPQPQSDKHNKLMGIYSADTGGEIVEVESRILIGNGPLTRSEPATRLDFTKPENRQAYARQKIAERLGPDGWSIVMAAEDNSVEGHMQAVAICRRVAQELRLSWREPTPTIGKYNSSTPRRPDRKRRS